MAAVYSTADMLIQKNSEILVKVEEALADLIVVSYSSENKRFQGVLLDSNKGNLPYGVYNLHPVFSPQNTSSNVDDKLASVSQRFAYTQNVDQSQHLAKKAVSRSKLQQKQKMTVRLRPRTVLCSNCQGVCNENNESVDTKRRKVSSEQHTKDLEKKFLMGSMLIPKLSRLHPNEISDAIKGRGRKNKYETVEDMEIGDHNNDVVPHKLTFVNVSEDINMNCKDYNKANNYSSIFSNAKTLKICFGEGEGTVVKIPPAIVEYNEDSGVCDISKNSDTKAAKRALKKAKKQAKKKNIMSDKTKIVSPIHIGALSPRNSQFENQSCFELADKKQKKIKHKKKRKITKQRDENSSKDDDTVNQKLSISLRRLSSNSYEKKEVNESDSEGWESDTVPEFPASAAEGTAGSSERVLPGDVVWGKVAGFPWWPGRVVNITATSKAHVSWYASSTSSLMPCDSLCPFLDNYKTRYNKKKRGAYKEAVKLAMIDANHAEPHGDPLASPTNNLSTSSPRPINVFS